MDFRVWDGTNDAGNPLAGGRYYWVIDATDRAGNQTSVDSSTSNLFVQIDSTLPTITEVYASPENFYPPESTTINYTLSARARWNLQVTVKIYDDSGNLVRTLLDAVTQAQGQHSISWDGTDDVGAMVENGVYTFRIEATEVNPGGRPGDSANPKEGTVVVYAPDPTVVSYGDVTLLHHEVATVTITEVSPDQMPPDAAKALRSAGQAGYYLVSPIYDIQSDPPGITFDLPALLYFMYSPELYGESLAIYRYDSATEAWVLVTPYVVDAANNRIIAEITQLSLYALMSKGVPPEVLQATVDVDPDVLNLRSHGKWITAYVELPEGYNVGDIDITTLKLKDVTAEPSPVGYEDHDGDGLTELVVKFSREEVAAQLQPGTALLRLTGEVNNKEFVGVAFVRVIEPGQGQAGNGDKSYSFTFP